MLVLSANTRIFVAVDSIDFRCGIDRLAQMCYSVLKQNPMSGAVFVFRNRGRTAIKALTYDGQGFWLCQKRWSTGKLNWWPTSTQPCQSVAVRELQILLWNGDPSQAAMAEDWRAVA